MMLPRDRLSYSSPFTRPPLKLPGGGRMIVWSVVNIEEWEITRPMARQLSQPPMGQTPIPDMPNWTWYEYGMRVGFWRLLRALDTAGVPPTMSINAKVCETYPEVAAAARDADWEFMAHSYVQMPIQQIEDQRAVIRQSMRHDRDDSPASGRPDGSVPAAMPDLPHPGLRHRIRPDLVRRLDSRRPAAMGEDRARPDPRRCPTAPRSTTSR